MVWWNDPRRWKIWTSSCGAVGYFCDKFKWPYKICCQVKKKGRPGPKSSTSHAILWPFWRRNEPCSCSRQMRHKAFQRPPPKHCCQRKQVVKTIIPRDTLRICFILLECKKFMFLKWNSMGNKRRNLCLPVRKCGVILSVLIVCVSLCA